MTKKKKLTIKIYHYVVKKRYLNGKNTYTYERMSIPIPTVLQHKLYPHCKRRIEIDKTKQQNLHHFGPRQNVFAYEKPPTKT